MLLCLAASRFCCGINLWSELRRNKAESFWFYPFSAGAGRGFAGDRAHPGEQGPQNAPAHLPSPRADQPLHELPLPHRDDPHREGADRPQARRRSGSEEKGKKRSAFKRFLVFFLVLKIPNLGKGAFWGREGCRDDFS